MLVSGYYDISSTEGTFLSVLSKDKQIESVQVDRELVYLNMCVFRLCTHIVD